MYSLEFVLEHAHISKDFASIDVKDANNLSLYIDIFDKGYQSLILLEDKKFKGFMSKDMFVNGFANGKLFLSNDIFVKYNDDEYTIKLNFAEMWQKYGSFGYLDIPILKDEEVVAVVFYSDLGGLATRLRPLDFPPIYWDLISDDLMSNLFNKENKKVLISSQYGSLKGFKERFKHLADIEVFDNTKLVNLLSHYYDIFIYDSCVLPTPPPSWYENDCAA